MIKLFRNIRKNLLNEGKTTNYFKYAIGEIVLVVVGILIALNINNWNENQKAIKTEEELMSSLEGEINDNIAKFVFLNSKNNVFKNTFNNVVLKLDNGIDSLSLNEISNTFNYYIARIQSPVLDVIVSSNSNVLIKNKALISEFRLLKSSYSEIEKQESYLDEFWNTKVTDFFISCGLSIESNIKKDSIISIKDFELGGYSKKQFMALINFKKELENYWEGRREIALKKSHDVLDLLKNTSE